MNIKELSSILQENGIVGAGGAGFPTYAKLNENAETIILNCAECEPLLRLHRQLLEKNAREIVETFYMMGQTMGSKDIVIGIKKAYKKAIEAIRSVINENKLVLKNEEIFVRLSELASSSLDIKVRVWTKNSDYWTVKWDLMEQVKAAFDANNIEIPFNQLDVNMKNQ